MQKQHLKRQELVSLFKSLGDPVRLQLVRMLASGMVNTLSVNDLTGKLGISQPAVSQHIRVLKNIGILEPERKGIHTFYRINITKLKYYKGLVDEMFKLVFEKCEAFPNYGKK